MASAEGIPYLGSRISIVSKSEIRYEGILYTVDTKQSTIALAKVKCLGTEGRPAERQVDKRDETYEYIIFKASDIKDLTVCETPKAVPQLYGNLPYDPAILQASQLNENAHYATERTAVTASSIFNGFGHLSPPPLTYQHPNLLPHRTRSSLSFGSLSGHEELVPSSTVPTVIHHLPIVPSVVDSCVQVGPGGANSFGSGSTGRASGGSSYSNGGGGEGAARSPGSAPTMSTTGSQSSVPSGGFRRPLLGSPIGARGQGPPGGRGDDPGPGGYSRSAGYSVVNRSKGQHHVSFSLDEAQDSPIDSRLNRSVGSLTGPRLERYSGRGVGPVGRGAFGGPRNRGAFRGSFNRGSYVNASFDSAYAAASHSSPPGYQDYTNHQFNRTNFFNRSFDSSAFDHPYPPQQQLFRDRFNSYNNRGRGFHGPTTGSNFVQPRFRRSNASDSADGRPVLSKTPELKFDTDYDFEEANASFFARLSVADGKESLPGTGTQDEGIDKKTEEDNEVARTEELAAAVAGNDANGDDGDGERSVTPKSTTPQPSDSGNESTSMPSPPLDVHYGSKYYNKELSFYDRISCQTMEKIGANITQNVNRLRQQDLNKETFGVAYARQMTPGGTNRGTAGMRVYGGRGRGYLGQGRGQPMYPPYAASFQHPVWTMPPFRPSQYDMPFPRPFHHGPSGYMRGGRGSQANMFRGRWMNRPEVYVM